MFSKRQMYRNIKANKCKETSQDSVRLLSIFPVSLDLNLNHTIMIETVQF
jgi:hypothetical protein